MKWLARDIMQGPFLCLVRSEKDFHSALTHLKQPRDGRPSWMKALHTNATCHHFTAQDGGLCAIVCVPEPPGGVDGIQIAALLVHEAVHIFQAYCDHIGEENPSLEFEAYSIQHISQQLMNAYAESVQ